MDIETLKASIEGVDIYILDQILKDRFRAEGKILDAGCGNGRNLKWFYQSGFEIFGTDIDADKLEHCKKNFSKQKRNFSVANIDQMPYEANSFDYILCNAVLHFAKNAIHFFQMFHELLRLLNSKGILFIRTASNFGIENQVQEIGNGVYKLPDGSNRFLLTVDLMNRIDDINEICLLEDVKTTIVRNKRSMTTLVIQKR